MGNAKILGLPESLHINSHQYGIALAVFYVFYIISEVPSVLLLKIVTPRRWLAALGIACGILGMCLAFVQNLAGFIVLRIILGLFEGGKSASASASAFCQTETNHNLPRLQC